jgi:hypothetical protein
MAAPSAGRAALLRALAATRHATVAAIVAISVAGGVVQIAGSLAVGLIRHPRIVSGAITFADGPRAALLTGAGACLVAVASRRWSARRRTRTPR